MSQQLNNLNKQFHNPDDDIVIVDACRTPLTKSKKGGLKDSAIEVMTQTVIKGILQRNNLPADKVDDLVFGNVLVFGSAFFNLRMAAFLAGLPQKTSCMTVNRLCSSGLEAVSQVANKIRSGEITIGIAGGVENMSLYNMSDLIDGNKIDESVFDNVNARNSMTSMGVTSENVANKYNISREDQDKFAMKSQQKALDAQKNGLYDSEIVPVKVNVQQKDGSTKEIIVTKDDGIRVSSLENLAKLKPAFKKNGSTTGGNSSQVTDGAAAVLLMKRKTAKQLNLKIKAKWIGFATQGCDPLIMGVGPLYAIPKVLKLNNMTIDQIDIFEINEAFASQALFCVKELKIDEKKVNPKGGAIALGHPLGCTGSRQIATLLPELKRQNKRFAVISMCIGTGMGAAAIIENEQN